MKQTGFCVIFHGVLVFGLLGGVTSHVSFAGPVTFQWSGYVSEVTSPLEGRFSSGDVMTATYTFESDSPNIGSGSPIVQSYFPQLIRGFMTVGDYSVSFTDTDVQISVVNDEVLSSGTR